MNGVALCRGIRLAADTASLPVILMSAAANTLWHGAGADAFLAKPFDIDDVGALLERWLPRETSGAATSERH